MWNVFQIETLYQGWPTAALGPVSCGPCINNVFIRVQFAKVCAIVYTRDRDATYTRIAWKCVLWLVQAHRQRERIYATHVISCCVAWKRQSRFVGCARTYISDHVHAAL